VCISDRIPLRPHFPATTAGRGRGDAAPRRPKTEPRQFSPPRVVGSLVEVFLHVSQVAPGPLAQAGPGDLLRTVVGQRPGLTPRVFFPPAELERIHIGEGRGMTIALSLCHAPVGPLCCLPIHLLRMQPCGQFGGGPAVAARRDDSVRRPDPATGQFQLGGHRGPPRRAVRLRPCRRRRLGMPPPALVDDDSRAGTGSGRSSRKRGADEDVISRTGWRGGIVSWIS
jgi:hypothetical protein